MRIIRYIVLSVVLLGMSGTIAAKPKAKAPRLSDVEQMRLDYYLYAALDASDRKDHAQAYFMLELCYHIDSLNPTVCSLMGAYYQSLYGLDKAYPLIRRAYEGSPHDYWYRYVVASYDAGLRSTAFKTLKDMEKSEPKNMDILDLHAHILRHERNYKEALAIQDKIDKLTGEPTVYSVLTRYEILCDQGSRRAAVQVLDNYLERNPNDGRVRAMRTDHYLIDAYQTRDKATGRKLLSEQLISQDVPLSTKLKKLQQHHAWLGYDADEQKRLLNELREQYPLEQEVYQALLTFEKEHGNPHAALEAGRTLLSMNPANSELREQVVDLMRDDSTTTDEEYRQFIADSYALLPDDPKWGYFKALLCYRENKIDSMLVVLDRAIEHAEEPTERLPLLILYGDMLGQQGEYTRAFAAYDEVLKLQPDHLGTLNNYAWSLAISGGDLKQAEKMSQRTIQKDGNNPTFLDTYAWILHLQGQDTLALFYIKKALEYAGETPDETLHEHYRIILEKQQ